MLHILVGAWSMVLVVLIGMQAATAINERQAAMPLEDSYERYCAEEDTLAPEIELVGGETVTILEGAKYTEAGATASDYCEVVENSTAGTVDTATAGKYELTYRAVDARGNVAEAVRTVEVRSRGAGVVYLTFDDGPGPYTARLLDMLAKYKVKATFFVTGMGDEALIAREYDEGHTVGLHSMSHNYAEIYQSEEAYFADLYAVQERVKRVTGQTVALLRFPGGSSNLVSTKYDGGTGIMSRLVAEVERRGFTYFDWNVLAGDAAGAESADEVFWNVVSGLRAGEDTIVLQHDVKEFSVEAVEWIIEYALEQGYVFDRLSEESFTAHHGVNN